MTPDPSPTSIPDSPGELCHICGIPNDKLGGEFCSAAHGQPAAPQQEPPQEIPQWAKEASARTLENEKLLSDAELAKVGELHAALKTVIAHILKVYGPDADCLTALETELGETAPACDSAKKEGAPNAS